MHEKCSDIKSEHLSIIELIVNISVIPASSPVIPPPREYKSIVLITISDLPWPRRRSSRPTETGSASWRKRWSGVRRSHALRRAKPADRLVDLQVDAAVVLHADDAQESADGLGGIALAADDLAHVDGADFEGDEDSHLVHRASGLDLVRIVH